MKFTFVEEPGDNLAIVTRIVADHRPAMRMLQYLCNEAIRNEKDFEVTFLND